MADALSAATAGFAATHTLALGVAFGLWSVAVWLVGVWVGRQVRRRQDWWDGWARRTERGRSRTWTIPAEDIE